ncbi:hypothetical protein AAON49_10305 [Pseudotenacibaculum sp. MALMAid0570]|uniref:hypothetical protein n=1 Tax=Pseudotenacibaculum sp. MALMAid0570 TaxID=3143938 RepID=UPI0032DF1150
MTSSIHGIFSQDLSLYLIGKDSTENSVLSHIDYQKKHRLEKSIYVTLDSIHEILKRKGYFTSIVEQVTKDKHNYTAKFSLGSKTKRILILFPEEIKNTYKNYRFTLKDSVFISPSKAEVFINSILNELDENGMSFNEVFLANPKQQNGFFAFDLKITSSRLRVIDKIITKGYEEFPEHYFKNYYKIGKNTVFSKKRLEEISNQTKSLFFLDEKKPPEVLFKKDSTILYLFLKKKNISSIDGNLSFASKENNDGVLINGNLDLKLKNVLNTGEDFELFWNRIKEGNSEFRVGTRVPYLFRLPISSSLQFNIYRQDSTFLNTKFNIALDYGITSKSTLFLSYASEKSDYLLNQVSNSIDDFSNYFFGVGYSYFLPSKRALFNEKIYFKTNVSLGKRNQDNFNSRQLKVESNATFNIYTSKASYIHINNKIGYLDSNNFLTNEVFRIGGINSIRGFNEQSIFTNRFSSTNIEYRYLTSFSSYLYTISDFGIFKESISNSMKNVFGVGFGYFFTMKNNAINLGYALGKNSDSTFNFKDSKFIISWKSFF